MRSAQRMVSGKRFGMSLARIQFLSLATKAITTAFGIIQSIIIIRVLSPAEYGLIGLVTSIGGVVGVTQHLGIVDGTIREIAILKSKRAKGTVFWVSQAVRQIVTIPLSVVLLLLAGWIAGSVYGKPEIAGLIQMFAAVLVLQGLQDVLGATVTGLKKFTALYGVQIITSAVNVAVFGWLTWQYQVAGFFVAMAVTTLVMVVLLGWVVRRELAGDLPWPDWVEVKKYARRVMRIGIYMYLARIFFVIWQRLPLLLLGGILSADQLGHLNVSLTFGSKLTIVAMALSEVNLAWMSSLYIQDRQAFIRVVTRNMHRVLVALSAMTLGLVFFVPEILRYVVGAEYLPAQHLILIMTLAFFLYALLDVGTSSALVAADRPRDRAILYGIMTSLSAGIIGVLLWRLPDPALAAIAVLAGVATAYVVSVWYSLKRLQLALVNNELLAVLAVVVGSIIWLSFEPSLVWRVAVLAAIGLVGGKWIKRSALWPEELKLKVSPDKVAIVCFAGAPYDAEPWTNRQQVMKRLSEKYAILYVEPRVWLVRVLWQRRKNLKEIVRLFWRIVWYEQRNGNLFIKSQWNLVPWSREKQWISSLNHSLNRFNLLVTMKILGFKRKDAVMWIYDTEAAEYLRDFKGPVIYDCVDDHAAQAGPDRNPSRVKEEEKAIMRRADLMTVTSQKLLNDKLGKSRRVELVLNAGNVELFLKPADKALAALELQKLRRPILGSIGSLDTYKIDIEMLEEAACLRPDWSFVLVGKPVVDKEGQVGRLQHLKNVVILPAIPQELAPAYVAWFDICLIPYRVNKYNEASFPLKFWEFMASGKPIVAAGVPELKQYQGLISYVEGAKELITEADKLLKQPDQQCYKRVDMAREHSWEKRVARLDELMLEAIRNHKL